MLVVTADGISSPFYHHVETVAWKRIATVERSSSGQGGRSLDVRVWHIVGRPKAGSGVPLSIPALALPIRTDDLVVEVLSYRPAD